ETNHGYQESCEETRQEGGQEDCPQVRQGEDRHGTQDRTQDGAEDCEESSEEAGTQARCQEDRAQAHREEGRDGQDRARQQDQACEESEEVSKQPAKLLQLFHVVFDTITTSLPSPRCPARGCGQSA